MEPKDASEPVRLLPDDAWAQQRGTLHRTGRIHQPHRPTVLIVDSCDTYRQALANLLRECGCSVEQAVSGMEGLWVARRRAPDLIIADLWPFFSGVLHMVEELRENEETRQIPVLVITSMVSPEYWSRALAAGCAEYLEKPCPPQRVIAEVARLVPGVRHATLAIA